MANRLGAAALSVLMFVLAGAFAQPAYAAGGTSDLLAAVNNVSGESDKFRSMMSNINASQIHVVNVQSMMSTTDESAYRKALKKNASGIADLRDTLNHTTVTGSDGVLITLRKLLQRQNVTIEQINGVYVGSDGTITLFYQ
jgi:Tfp pilus assembly protein PilW